MVLIFRYLQGTRTIMDPTLQSGLSQVMLSYLKPNAFLILYSLLEKSKMQNYNAFIKFGTQDCTKVQKLKLQRCVSYICEKTLPIVIDGG